ncbi:aspartic proteinase CDR1-like [Macadamia integrifolia]|uniref:aspartic proteinase CDR1-like n=1 Tax=Macadamia integrifolia TaxID=60698 RepID=UPI001C4F310A|nr:aspartic proteinase CDR1-like [Macadamia integrifolia]
MATAFPVYALFIIFSFTIFISLPCLSINTSATNPKNLRFALDLIHRDSPLSPFYNPRSTFWDKAERLYESSIARYAYMASKGTSDKYRIDSNVEKFLYYAKIRFGAPAVDLFVVVDTGSELFWVQCEPCSNCQSQTGPIYDRTKSITYSNVTCGSLDCKLAPNMKCDSDYNVCSYRINYGDGSFSNGLVAKDALFFRNPGGSVVRKNVVFGCGIHNQVSAHGLLGGILGLAATKVSVVSQLGGRKFSYCLGNSSDPSSKGNVIIGEDAHIAGFTTPFTFYKSYQVYPVEIKVGSKSLDLPPWAFGAPASVMLDSGTAYTFLPQVVHDKIADAISQTLKSFKVQPIPPPIPGLSCYNGNIGRDLNGFPTMTIRFRGQAELVLEKWSIFIPKGEDSFCLAFAPAVGRNSESLIGGMAQQFYNFGFDFDTMELSIIHSVCIY